MACHRGRRWLSAAVVAMLGLGMVQAQGVAELSLDRGAVRSLLAAALAQPVPVAVAGLGALTLHVEPPQKVHFRQGGVEADVTLRVEPLALQVDMAVRYEPQVDAASGVVSLQAVSAVPRVPLPLDADLAALLPPLDLPRRWSLPLHALLNSPSPMQVLVQGLSVEEDRLVVRLGLVMPPEGR